MEPNATPPTATPEIPRPFGPAPTEPRTGGCGKPALIGCGVVFLLIGVAAVVFLMKARELLVWSLEKTKAGVEASLAPEVTAADRARFDAAFAAAVVSIRSGKIDPASLQNLQGQLMRAIQQPGQQVTRDQFLKLVEAMEKVGGVTPPDEVPPAPAPGDHAPPAPAPAPEKT